MISNSSELARAQKTKYIPVPRAGSIAPFVQAVVYQESGLFSRLSHGPGAKNSDLSPTLLLGHSPPLTGGRNGAHQLCSMPQPHV